DVAISDPDRQPFGASGGRGIEIDGRQLVVPNVAGRALIVDLTGPSPFVAPAPVTNDPHAARRIDLGHRYAANGRLRPAFDLLKSAEGDDVATALIALVNDRLQGIVTDSDWLPLFTLAVRGVVEGWTVAPHSSITLATISPQGGERSASSRAPS